jgi:hypothetical protein
MSATIKETPPTKAHDARGFWRVLLAIVVPIPWLAKGIQYIVLEPEYDHTADQITYDMAHDVYKYLQWLDVLFVVLVVPSVLAMVLVSRRGAPRLSAAATLLMGGGFLMVLPLNIGSDQLAWIAAQNARDPAVIGQYLDDAAADPRAGLGVLGFLVAIVFGSILIALALWKSQAVAGWAATLVGLGGATHIFIGGLGHVVHGAGLVVLALGCVAVSRRLLKMSNDEFDLPPTHASGWPAATHAPHATRPTRVEGETIQATSARPGGVRGAVPRLAAGFVLAAVAVAATTIEPAWSGGAATLPPGSAPAGRPTTAPTTCMRMSAEWAVVVHGSVGDPQECFVASQRDLLLCFGSPLALATWRRSTMGDPQTCYAERSAASSSPHR